MALFCTDTFLDVHRDRLAAVAPDLDVVVLRGGEEVTSDDIGRISIAFFSNDAWPERAAPFMKVALEAANLRWLHSMSAGVDSPIFSMFMDRGVRVTTSSGASAPTIAGTVMLYLLALSRNAPSWMRAQVAHEWRPSSIRDLDGQRLVVVGFGPIGQEVVRLARAFGMESVVVRRAALGDEPCPVVRLDRIAEAVRGADAIVLALPLTDATRGVVSADVIAAMAPTTMFVNVGRGELVDQAALTAALSEGRLGGAGLDVFATEPLPADDPLWDLPNVIISPHTSGSGDRTSRRVVDIFLDNLGRYVNGEALIHEVRPA